jgi:hypothetical protein
LFPFVRARNSAEIGPLIDYLFHAVPGASSVLCKRPFPSLRRRLSGPWESGNPAFGFPLFHGPTLN